MNEYHPVSCEFFDKIEDFAERKEEVKIAFFDDNNNMKSVVGHITNIFTEDKQEFLVVDYDDEIRLDQILKINQVDGPASENAGWD